MGHPRYGGGQKIGTQTTSLVHSISLLILSLFAIDLGEYMALICESPLEGEVCSLKT
jgi:hypothetical protein